MQEQPFPRYASAGPNCPACGGETLLSKSSPRTFECLDCGLAMLEPSATDALSPGGPLKVEEA